HDEEVVIGGLGLDESVQRRSLGAGDRDQVREQRVGLIPELALQSLTLRRHLAVGGPHLFPPAPIALHALFLVWIRAREEPHFILGKASVLDVHPYVSRD